MKQKNKINICTTSVILILVLTGFGTKPGQAQTDEGQINVFFSIPEVALIDIESNSGNNINFTIIPSNESGSSMVVNETSEEQLWINYSSALASSKTTRTIVAEIAQGNLPRGVTLYLEASSYTGSGNGELGQPTSKVSLSSQPVPIITGVGSCFTGDGVNNGHLLTFSVEVEDYSLLKPSEQSFFTVLYTITDN